ncbi:hypothetical protein [Spirosoma arcticum]
MSKGSFRDYWQKSKLDYSKWNDLVETTANRLKKPVSHPEFILYFSVIIVIVGLAGVFTTLEIELRNCLVNHGNITLSIATYFIALLASSSADLILSSDDPAKSESQMKILRLVGICSVLLGVGLFWLTNVFKDELGYIPAMFGLILALSTWWLANAENPNLTKPVDPSGANPTGNNLDGDDPSYIL